MSCIQTLPTRTKSLAQVAFTALLVFGFGSSLPCTNPDIVSFHQFRSASEREADFRLQELIKRNAEVKRVLAVVKRFAPLDANTRGLATLIVRESARSGLDPLYVAAIVKSESTFQPSARSNKHAKGLMQITPITERELAATVDLSGIKKRDLADAQYNLRLGTTYLRQLEKKFKGDRSLALVAYNWGPGHVMAALRGEKQIPRESLEYARQVLANHQSWSALG